jgi:hypothetical protein
MGSVGLSCSWNCQSVTFVIASLHIPPLRSHR